jgi:tetratricopeptide (TPR) repeat protein/transcriptional regulator with XRE-family HTH domain
MLHSKDVETSVPYPNNVKHCIKRQGYTIQEVADETGIPRRTLTHYLSGKAPIPRQSLEKIAHTIGCDIEELIIQPLQPSSQQLALPNRRNADSPLLLPAPTEFASLPMQGMRNEDMAHHFDRSRRQFLQMLGTGVTLTVTSQTLLNAQPWERLSKALAKPSSIDEATLAELEAITKSYWTLRARSASPDLLHGILGHLETLTQFLQSSLLPTTRNRLCTLAGETAQIAGQTFFDMHDYSSAFACYQVSLEAAQEAGDLPLQAIGLGRMSFLRTYSGQPETALSLIQEAQRLAEQSATIITRSWLAAVEAEAQAKLDTPNTTACLKALERAERIVDQNTQTPEEDPYRTGFNPSRLEGYKGVCYIHLQQPETARNALHKALTLVSPLPMRRRSTIFTDLAATHVQEGNIEEASQLLHQALDITTQTKSLTVLQRIRNLRAKLQQWENSQVVKNIDEHITSVLIRLSY